MLQKNYRLGAFCISCINYIIVEAENTFVLLKHCHKALLSSVGKVQTVQITPRAALSQRTLSWWVVTMMEHPEHLSQLSNCLLGTWW
jgi:hypothetical protein